MAPTGGYPLNVGQWYYAALVFNPSGTSEFYCGTAVDASLTGPGIETLPLAGIPGAASVVIATDGLGDYFNGRVAQVKIWSAMLTKTELEAEWKRDGIARTANLWAYHSFRNGPQTNDESGNGHTLTAGGTLVAEAGPPSEVAMMLS